MKPRRTGSAPDWTSMGRLDTREPLQPGRQQLHGAISHFADTYHPSRDLAAALWKFLERRAPVPVPSGWRFRAEPIINPEGTVVSHFIGERSESELIAALKQGRA